MKKLLSIILALACIFSLYACANVPPASSSPNPDLANTPEPTNTADSSSAVSMFTPGTYQGTDMGNSGDIKVSVTVSEDAITDITVDEMHDTYYLFDYVERLMLPAIIAEQSICVDVVSGATISSNGFLRAVENALTQSGTDVNALKKPIERTITDVEETYDAVVVGAGGAGLVAALRLQQQDINVILLEQLDVVGGTTLLSGGTFLMASDEATANSYRETIMGSLYVDDFLVADGAPDIDRINQNIDNTIQLSEMFADMGVTLETYYGTDYILNGAMPDQYKSYLDKARELEPDGYFSMGSWTVWQFENAYLSHGGKLLTGTKATELIMDAKGNVTGVKALSDNSNYTFHADHVILATGGYTHNEALIAQYLPVSVGDYFCTSIGADGSGIEMALNAGGVMTDYNYVNGVEKVAYMTDAYRTFNGSYKWSDINVNYAMIVGREGERVTNESNPDYFRYFQYPDAVDQYWGIYTTAMLEEMGQLEFFEQEAQKCKNAGPYYAADTLEELAEYCDFKADTFTASVGTFNQFCETGVETFQTKDSGSHLGGGDTVNQASSDAEKKLGLTDGKFYAVRITAVGFDVIGGVKTNANGQVVDATGSPVGGLYAVGFTSSRDFQGSGAASHYCNGLSIASGFTAAEYVVEALMK